MTDHAPSITARAALVKDWGFPSGHIALHAFRQALEGETALPPSPALTFSDAESYRAARAAWRARQKGIEARIRQLKAARRASSVWDQACAQSEAAAWAVLAQAALIERRLQKRKAALCWEQSHAHQAA